jgi:hypothetical protein
MPFMMLLEAIGGCGAGPGRVHSILTLDITTILPLNIGTLLPPNHGTMKLILQPLLNGTLLHINIQTLGHLAVNSTPTLWRTILGL